jgi:glycosyltransferase involved in cell wall biosynthesis
MILPAPAVPALSAVMPAYNEEEAIGPAVEEVRAHVLEAVPGSELVVVDDGSTDGTAARLDGLAAGDPRVRVVHQENAGHGAALRAGMEAARGEMLFLLDSDRQVPLESFAELWAAAGESGAALGVRRVRRDPLYRRVLTVLVRLALRLLFGCPLRDANCPFKILRRRDWEEFRGLVPPGTLAPSIFLAVLLARRPGGVPQLEVPHLPRRTGTVSLRPWKLLRFCARAFGQLLGLRRRLRAAGRR